MMILGLLRAQTPISANERAVPEPGALNSWTKYTGVAIPDVGDTKVNCDCAKTWAWEEQEDLIRLARILRTQNTHLNCPDKH